MEVDVDRDIITRNIRIITNFCVILAPITKVLQLAQKIRETDYTFHTTVNFGLTKEITYVDTEIPCVEYCGNP
jgi:hypothetical protein